MNLHLKLHLPEMKTIINRIWNMLMKILSTETMSESWMEQKISFLLVESNSKDK